MRLATPEKIQKLQRKLYLKAKREFKHKVGSCGECRYPASYIYETLCLVNPDLVLKNSRTPSGRTWSESRMRESRTSGSMSGRWKRGTV